ncbi:MAG: hypothetical protein ACRDHW_03980 [Ktedonobacteraceae bacterium]
MQATTFTHGCAPNTPPPVAGTPVSPPATSGSVWVNEVLSNPKTNWNCSDPSGSFSPGTDSWIELYNPQSEALNLYAVHAEISLDSGTNWYTLPFGSAIAPGGFLVVFPLEGVASPPSAWSVVLAFASLNSIIDQANIPALLPDQSYARVPDGSANWQPVGAPTIDASNNASNQPITATATKTPAPTKTSKPPRGSGSAGSTGVTPPANTGTQPAGNQLQLPPTVTSISQTPGAAATPASGQSLASASTTSLDIWHIVMLIALLLLFGGSLTWCWRLFHPQ